MRTDVLQTYQTCTGSIVWIQREVWDGAPEEFVVYRVGYVFIARHSSLEGAEKAVEAYLDAAKRLDAAVKNLIAKSDAHTALQA